MLAISYLRTRTIFLAAALCGGILFVVQAWAFIHPPEHAVDQWLKRIKRVRTLKIEQVTTLFDRSFPGGSVDVKETVWMQRPNLYRKLSRYPQGEVNLVLTAQKALRIENGESRVAPVDQVLAPPDLFYLARKEGRLLGSLRLRGVDLGQSRWALDEREVLLEIGQKEGNSVKFSREPYTLAEAKLGSKTWRFAVRRSSGFGVAYPVQTEVLEDGKVIQSTQVTKVKMNIKLPTRIFSSNRLAKTQKKR